MDKNLYDDSFDELLRSKYKNEQVMPTEELWENIHSSLNSGITHVSVWTKISRFLWPALGITVASVIILSYFFILKPKENIPIKNREYQVEKNKPRIPEKNAEHIKRLVTPSAEPEKQPVLKNNLPEKTVAKKFSITPHNQSVSNKVSVPANNFGMKIHSSAPKVTSKSVAFSKTLKPLKTKTLSQFPLQNSTTGVVNLLLRNFNTQQLPISNNPGKGNISYTKNNGSNNKKLSVKIFINPEISFRYLTNNPAYSNSEYNKTYFDKRDKYAITYSYGFTASYRLSGRFRVKTGVLAAPYSIRFSTDKWPVIHNDENNETMIYTSSGIAKVTIHSSDSISTNTLLNSSLNLFYINVPIVINYKISKHFSIGSGLFFEKFAGQNINWKAENYKGDVEISNEGISGISDFTMGITFEAEYEKPVFKNLYFSISPNFSMHVLSINNKNAVKSYPYTLGFQFGIKYYLF